MDDQPEEPTPERPGPDLGKSRQPAEPPPPPGYGPPSGPPPGYAQPGAGTPGYGPPPGYGTPPAPGYAGPGQPGPGQPAYPPPGYGQPGYGQPPPGYGQPPARVDQGLRNHAIAALVVNAIAFFTCCVGLPGTVLAAVALSKVEREPASARKLLVWAWVALGICVALAVVAVLVVALAAWPFGDHMDSYSNSTRY